MLPQRNRVGSSTVWPRLETGNSSVAPWTTPSTIAWKVVIRWAAANESKAARLRGRGLDAAEVSHLDNAAGRRSHSLKRILTPIEPASATQTAVLLGRLGGEQLGLGQDVRVALRPLSGKADRPLLQADPVGVDGPGLRRGSSAWSGRRWRGCRPGREPGSGCALEIVLALAPLQRIVPASLTSSVSFVSLPGAREQEQVGRLDVEAAGQQWRPPRRRSAAAPRARRIRRPRPTIAAPPRRGSPPPEKRAVGVPGRRLGAAEEQVAVAERAHRPAGGLERGDVDPGLGVDDLVLEVHPRRVDRVLGLASRRRSSG